MTKSEKGMLELEEPPKPEEIAIIEGEAGERKKGVLSHIFAKSVDNQMKDELRQIKVIENELEDMKIQAEKEKEEYQKKRRDLEKSAQILEEQRNVIETQKMAVTKKLDDYQLNVEEKQELLNERMHELKNIENDTRTALREIREDIKILEQRKFELRRQEKEMRADMQILERKASEVLKDVKRMEKDKRLLEEEENRIIGIVDVMMHNKRFLEKKERELVEKESGLVAKEAALARKEDEIDTKIDGYEQLVKEAEEDRGMIEKEEVSLLDSINELRLEKRELMQEEKSLSKAASKLVRRKMAPALPAIMRPAPAKRNPALTKTQKKEIASALKKAQKSEETPKKKPDVEALKNLIAYAKKQAMVKQFSQADITYKKANEMFKRLRKVDKEDKTALKLELGSLYSEIQLGMLNV